MLITKSGERKTTEGLKQQNQERIRTLEEKELFEYLGILEINTIKKQR